MSNFLTAASLNDLPGIRHGFFGRQGGVSQGLFSSNNMSLTTGDTQEAVAANQAEAAGALGFAPDQLCLLKQVHSTRVEQLDAPLGDRVVEADAMVTNTPGLLLGILTADCTPILLADPEAGVIGAAHVGWRGAVDGIIGATVEAMMDLGAQKGRIRASYGPTIYGDNYEVGEQFRADFLKLHPGGRHHFHTPAGGKPHFNLPGFVEEQLGQAGLASVERVGTCTYAAPDRYFSHRRATHEGTTTGRQVSVIGLTQL